MKKESWKGGQKREAEGRLEAVPTLRKVAEEERFDSIRELIRPIEATPVSELSEGVRTALLKKGEEGLELVLQAFFSAFDAHVREIERKRAHVDAGQRVQGL